MHIGDNQSKSKGILNALKKAQSYNSKAIQIFLRSPMRRSPLKISQNDLQNTKTFLQNNNMKMVIHSSYLYNFCKTQSEIDWCIEDLIEEINMATQLGAIGCIIHMGKSTKLPTEQAIQNYITNINSILNAIPDNGAKLILENSAHQGTEIGYTIQQIAEIHQQINHKERVGYCLDTCHAFAAGYNINENPSQLYQEFCELIGEEYLSCIHLNDSKKECGCKVDRHDNIDNGKINTNALKEFLQTINHLDIPVILETPDETTENRKREIDLLKN